jgi:hypothetical protein
MAQYYILNTNTGELHSQWEDQALAEETCNSLNDSQPYDSTDAYACFSEAGYRAYVEGLPGLEYVPIYSVYGVGKYSDAYPPMEELLVADEPSVAKKLFEKRHSQYKAVDAYQVM